MPQVLIDHLTGERAGACDSFDGDVLRVGRSAECELAFEEMGVSWNHAEIRYRDGDFWVVDGGSTNGTYVNDEPAHNARLQSGDVLRFGKKGPLLRFRVAGQGEGAGAAPAVSSSSADGPAGSQPSPPPQPRPRRRLPSEPDHPVLDARSDLPAAASQRSSSSTVVLVLCLGVVAAASWAVAGLFYLEAGDLEAELAQAQKQSKEAREELQALEADVESRLEAARNEGKQLVQNLADAQVDRLERELERSRRRWEEKSSGQAERIKSLERALAQAKSRLARLRSSSGTDGDGASSTEAWKRLERRLAGSVVFIATRLEGETEDGEAVPLHTYGTGFFASHEGHVVTNKHVVQPWKFRELAERLAREGISVVEDSYAVHLWPGGRRFLQRHGDGKVAFDLSRGYSTRNDTLEVVRTAPDEWKTRPIGGDGSRSIRVHTPGDGDLALLQADVPPDESVAPIPTGKSDRVEKLDEVLVLGFPAGPSVLKRGIAETSPARGQVRKVEQTIFVTAPMVGGNSGGPLIDRHGRVVGISTRVVDGTETMGSCLRIEHATQLLHGGSW